MIRLAGSLLLIYFLFTLKIDFNQVFNSLVRANLWYVLIAVLLVFPFIGLKAYRWQIILKSLEIKIPYILAYRFYAGGLAAGSFTPGQAGDAIKAWYLKERGFPFGAGLVSVVLDRLFDLAVLLLLGSGGILFLGTDFAGELPGLILLLSGTLAGLFILSNPVWRNGLIGLVLKLGLRKKNSKANEDPTEVEETGAVRKLQPVSLLPVFGFTLLASALALFRIWLLALALGLNLNFLQVVAVSSLATAISLVPFSVGGIGARDALLAFILLKLGYSRESGVSLSTFILLLNLVNLVFGYLIWLSNRTSYNHNRL